MVRKFYRLLFVAVVFFHSCGAQETVVLNISVLDENKVGIPHAEIKLSTGKSTIIKKTNLEGETSIGGMQKGSYAIDVSAVGYHTLKNYSIRLESDQERINVEMQSPNNLSSPNVEWDGGWVTLEDKEGKIKSIRLKKKD